MINDLLPGLKPGVSSNIKKPSMYDGSRKGEQDEVRLVGKIDLCHCQPNIRFAPLLIVKVTRLRFTCGAIRVSEENPSGVGPSIYKTLRLVRRCGHTNHTCLCLLEMDQVAIGIFEIKPLHPRARAMQIVPYLADFYTFAREIFMGCGKV